MVVLAVKDVRLFSHRNFGDFGVSVVQLVGAVKGILPGIEGTFEANFD